MNPTTITLLVAIFAAGCTPSAGMPDGSDFGGDAQAFGDARVGRDAGTTTGHDSSASGGDSAASATDADVDAAICTSASMDPPATCDTVHGIECDGDWTGRCMPSCESNECCSPQRGNFQCMMRDSQGRCPLPDLRLATDLLRSSLMIEEREFASDDCAVVEGCIVEPGLRRLLRFETTTRNYGTADLYVGSPDQREFFGYSSCHEHYHFERYAEYELLDEENECVVVPGHKQAFCLIDSSPFVVSSRPYYDCDNQGIQAGWQDVYTNDLDCQWVDITDVAPGEYRLRVRINGERLLPESDYTNNVDEVRVRIPAR